MKVELYTYRILLRTGVRPTHLIRSVEIYGSTAQSIELFVYTPCVLEGHKPCPF